MGINRDKPDKWKEDIVKSVDFYNSWFMQFAPKAFRDTRIKTAKSVKEALHITENLTIISPELLKNNPSILPILRMSTCPPIARDRLIGLSGASKNLVKCMEREISKIPSKMKPDMLDVELNKIGNVIKRMADPDIFLWINRNEPATETEIQRASTIIADRLCGAVSDPIVRNAQEKRQLAAIGDWLNVKGYKLLPTGNGVKFNTMPPGTYSFRMNIPVAIENIWSKKNTINIPVDVVIMLKNASAGDLPLLIEAKSAGDFTNVNKRRKEEAQKMTQLKKTYGEKIKFGLFLCGYFDSGYLGYEASEGIDWVWEHRIEDFSHYGI